MPLSFGTGAFGAPKSKLGHGRAVSFLPAAIVCLGTVLIEQGLALLEKMRGRRVVTSLWCRLTTRP